MKRCPALRNLSSEHHQGLVLARRVKAAAGTDGAVTAWNEARTRFFAELEPHFRFEEDRLLPALARAGEAGLARRTLDEHAGLRRLISEGDARVMAEFAGLLERHIRFEESELFEAAQRKLTAAELDALDEGSGVSGSCCKH